MRLPTLWSQLCANYFLIQVDDIQVTRYTLTKHTIELWVKLVKSASDP